MKRSLAVLALLIDKVHSQVGFQVRHFVSQVSGTFNDFEGTIVADAAKVEASSVDFKIKATSVDTRNEKRDNHLRSDDFFGVEKFPEITFKSKSVKKTGADTFDVAGTLTMHGVAKEVTLPVKYLGTMGDKGGFELSTTLNRKDYGINFNRAVDQGGMMLGDDVKIVINLEVSKAKPEAAAAK
jgi:polyisoprenoid-binding protein YceI